MILNSASGRDEAGNAPGVDRLLDHGVHLRAHLMNEPEAAPVLADAGHGPVHEHERKYLGVRLAESIDAHQRPADRVQRVRGLPRGDPLQRGFRLGSAGKEEPESLFREREEDVVLAGEIAVNRSRAVFDAFSDLADRDVPYPSMTNRSRAASRIERETALRSRSWRSLTPTLACLPLNSNSEQCSLS